MSDKLPKIKQGCLQCGTPIGNTPGRRPKKFCSVNCRVKYHFHNKKSNGQATGVPLPADYLQVDKVAILTPSGEVKPFEATVELGKNALSELQTDQKAQLISDYDLIKAEIEKTTTVKELEEVVKKIKTSLMTMPQKDALHNFARNHSRQFYTD